ncbi:MAG: hypothetical protein ACE5JH_01125 [Acidobacteriota bacterium]
MGVLRRSGAAWALIACAATALSCGGAPGAIRVLPGPTARINPIYDFLLRYPDTEIVVGGMTYRGLEIDLEIEFSDATLRDDDPRYLAEARVLSLLAGGVPQAFEAFGPLDIEGTLADGLLATGLFGPIRVGTANLIFDLGGTLRDGARRVDGEASIFGLTDRGFFNAVKRRRYLVAGTDLLTIGEVSVISVRYDSRFSIEENLEVISSDPVARMEDGRPFVINRLSFDNLQGLDPFAGFSTAFQHSVGNGANPHDLVVVSDATSDGAGGLAFVTRYEPPFNDVGVFDLSDGVLIDRIDLTPYALNEDRLPRADQALLLDGLIYVTLQDANRSFTEFLNGRVAVIDPSARRVIDVIDLEGQNPFRSLLYSGSTGKIYVALAGIFPGLRPQALTGGVEVIDPVTRRSEGLLVDDDDLGGNVSSVAIASAARGYCVVTDESFRNSVRSFDPATGEVLGTVLESPGQITEVVADGDGFLLIAEAGFLAPRVLVLDAHSGAAVSSLPTRVMPFSIAILTRSL